MHLFHKIGQIMASSVDPDQTAQSDLGSHGLHFPFCHVYIILGNSHKFSSAQGKRCTLFKFSGKYFSYFGMKAYVVACGSSFQLFWRGQAILMSTHTLHNIYVFSVEMRKKNSNSFWLKSILFGAMRSVAQLLTYIE